MAQARERGVPCREGSPRARAVHRHEGDDLTRAAAIIALEGIGHDGNERVVAAVMRSDYVLAPELAKLVEQMIEDSHVRTSFFASRGLTAQPSRTRGDPNASKFGWEG